MSSFASLPAEIRLEIWRLSCPRRVVEVIYNCEKDRCRTSAATPSVLHACQESRHEALRLYKRLFGTKSHRASIYFCSDLDVLYIPRPKWQTGYDNASRDFASLVSGAGEIQSLALDHVDPATRRPWEVYNKYVLMQSFPLVREVSLILAPEYIMTRNQARPSASLKLVDPCCDQEQVCRLLAGVRSSFLYEIGATFKSCRHDSTVSSTPDIVLKSKVSEGYLRVLWWWAQRLRGMA
jgi:hypothetical protein